MPREPRSPLPERPAWFVAADGTVAQLTPDRDLTPPTVGIRSLTYVG